MKQEYDFSAVDRLLQEQVKNNAAYGCAVRVIKDGKRVYDSVVGYADKEEEKPLCKNTIYRLYSMTKPITAAAAMILYDRGAIDLHDSVCKYLEGFRDASVHTKDGIVRAKRDVEIIDLLTMTAGLMYPDRGINPTGEMTADLFDEFYRRAFEEGTTFDTVELCNSIGKIPLFAHPGEIWNYSACADVLGAVIEKASGKRFGDFLKDEIFTPLGMADTDFYVPDEKRERLAQIYLRDEKGVLNPCDWQHLGLVYKYTKRPEFESGGAGLVSTVDDYEKFASMLLCGGVYNGVRILTEKSVDLISHNLLTDSQRAGLNWESCVGCGYGGLMRVLEAPEKALSGKAGEYGWDGWTGNYFCNDPKNRLTFLYFIQVCGGNGVTPIAELKNAVYRALEN